MLVSCLSVHFSQLFDNTGYTCNLKSARNGKSLRHLALNCKFILHFEFVENLEDIYGKCHWRARSCCPTTFSIQIFLFFRKIQMVQKPHSLMPGTSNLAILIFLTSFFLSDILNCTSYSPQFSER